MSDTVVEVRPKNDFRKSWDDSDIDLLVERFLTTTDSPAATWPGVTTSAEACYITVDVN